MSVWNVCALITKVTDVDIIMKVSELAKQILIGLDVKQIQQLVQLQRQQQLQ